jgi:hypothetical protein
MSSYKDEDDVRFPPGTIRLEARHNATIVLSPQPSSDPNDPLVRLLSTASLVVLTLDNRIGQHAENAFRSAYSDCKSRLATSLLW